MPKNVKVAVVNSLLLLLILNSQVQVQAQQTYVNNKQLDCYNGAFNSITKGFVCNATLQSSCQSYLTFRSSLPYYSTPVSISYLLGAQDSATLIASINNLSSDVASIPVNTQVIVPVNCSCYDGQYYQHNATYTLKIQGETYFSVANDTYQGLSTCQAMMSQNPTYGDRNLSVGNQLLVPLRCACPSPNQIALGFKYLLTYMVTWGHTISSIAQLFGVDQQSVLDANELSSTSIIFPFTPILVPLTKEPTKITPIVVSPPPQTPTISIPVGRSNSSSKSNKGVFIGVGSGAAALVLFLAAFGFLLWYRRSSSKSTKKPDTVPPLPNAIQSDYSELPDNSKSWSISSHGIRDAIESLTVYKFKDLEIATDYFSQDRIIKGSVHKGSFNGDAAAIKVIKGDVSTEINILKNINHSNVVRLSGFCLHQSNSYLVYEFAENGSLTDWLRPESHHNHSDSYTLSWKQRVQIAYDVGDALNYLHTCIKPPYIHKNLKSSNILLDANLRAKIGNFGLARTLQSQEGGMHFTRHVVGTQGYLAPEYVENGAITPKLDVFAFGVVILELLSGKEAAASVKELLSASIDVVLEGDDVRGKFNRFMDPSLRNEYPLDVAFSLAQLAKSCVYRDLNSRPSMPQLFTTLSKILSSSLDWDPSLELQSSRSMSSGG